MNNSDEVDLLDLLRKIAAHDSESEAAFEQLYKFLFKPFFGFCNSVLRDRHLAEDVTQDMLFKVFEKASFILKTLEENNNKPASPNVRWYLWIMIKHGCTYALRRQKNKKNNIDIEDIHEGSIDFNTFWKLLPPPQELDDQLIQQEKEKCAQKVWVLFKQQQPKHAQAIKQQFFDGLSTKEIAEQRGSSAGAARQFLSDSRQRLNELFKQLCPDYD